MTRKSYPKIAIYAVEHRLGKPPPLVSEEVEVHGNQVWALGDKRLGLAFSYARRLDRAAVDETPEAAVRRFADTGRSIAADLRAQATKCEDVAFAAERLLSDQVECQRNESGVVIDTDRERVLAYLRAAPLKDRIGGPFYPPVAVEMALALEKDGLVRLVDYQCSGGGCWLVDLLERDR